MSGRQRKCEVIEMNLFHIICSESFLYSVLRVSTSLIFAGMAAVVSELSGVSNIGIEGCMLMAAFVGVCFSALFQSAGLGLLFAVLSSVLMVLIMAYFILNLGTHFVMSGLALNMLSKGITIFALFLLTGQKGASTAIPSVMLPKINIPLVENIPVLGAVVSGQNILTYLAFAGVAVLWLILYKTPLGTRIRAAGESPAAAESVGINLRKTRYIALIISGIFAGFGGAFLSMGQMDGFTANMTAGRGFIALAAESMGQMTPWGTTAAAVFFGATSALANSLQMLGLPVQFVSAIPYASTLVGITIYSLYQTRRVKNMNRRVKVRKVEEVS